MCLENFYSDFMALEVKFKMKIERENEASRNQNWGGNKVRILVEGNTLGKQIQEKWGHRSIQMQGKNTEKQQKE